MQVSAQTRKLFSLVFLLMVTSSFGLTCFRGMSTDGNSWDLVSATTCTAVTCGGAQRCYYMKVSGSHGSYSAGCFGESDSGGCTTENAAAAALSSAQTGCVHSNGATFKVTTSSTSSMTATELKNILDPITSECSSSTPSTPSSTPSTPSSTPSTRRRRTPSTPVPTSSDRRRSAASTPTPTSCSHTNNGATTDANGNSCNLYYGYDTAVLCGNFDTANFNACTMCCGCGGGSAPNPQVSCTRRRRGASPQRSTITQALTFPPPASVSTFVGVVKTTYEAAFARSIGLWDNTANSIKQGSTVSSSASLRRSTTVAFVASVAASDVAAASSASNALTPTLFATAVQNTITDTGVGATVLVITPTAVSAPIVQQSGASASTSDVSRTHADLSKVIMVCLCVSAVVFAK